MCGRFALTLPSDAVARLFDAVPANHLPEVPNHNICPTNPVHSVVSGEDGRRLLPMRWGFIPHWYSTPAGGPLLINARSETVAEKPAFRAAARERRCLVPASGFYEWTKDAEGNRLPWYFRPPGDGILAFAGVWQDWSRGEERFTTCAIVTTAATGPMTDIHHRTPVVVAPEDWPLWLGEAGKGAARLMHPPDADALEWFRVDPKVNSNRARGADLIAPI